MRKLIIVVALMLVVGCANIQKSDFLNHDTMYRNWDHMAFSILGSDDLVTTHEQSVSEDWWGIPQKVEE